MRHTERDTEENIPLGEQASHWWVTLHGESVSPADKHAFGEWVSASPQHVAAYLRAERAMRAVKTQAIRWPELSTEDLVREAKQESAARVVSIASANQNEPGAKAPALRPPAGKGRFRVGPALSAMAAVLVIAALGALLYIYVNANVYETGYGEERSVLLADGSLVTLNTASRITVSMQKGRRQVTLVRGEALFRVARDASRPFDVLVGTTRIRAVGTEFNVDKRPAHTTVTVVEGKVAVLADAFDFESSLPGAPIPASEMRNDGIGPEPWQKKMPVLLVAAQRIVVTDTGVGSPEQVDNLAAATAWTQRQLVFERRALGDVAAEFNRYNQQAIHIEDPSLRQQEVTGVFQANDPASFLDFISSIPGVETRRADNGDYVVSAKPDSPQ